MGMSVVGKFEKWCRGRGEFVKRAISVSCDFQRQITLGDVDDFLKFIDENRRELLAGRRYEVCIVYREKLTPSIEMSRFICYSSLDDDIRASTYYFGEPSEDFFKFIDVEKFKRGIELSLHAMLRPHEKWAHADLSSKLKYDEIKREPKLFYTMLEATRLLS